MLEAFLPRAGRVYCRERNIDFGPQDRSNLSGLSPWVRLRLIPEWVILKRVLERHSRMDAAKWIDEVCWRSYWKGWLRLRPSVWHDYLAELGKARANRTERARRVSFRL